MELNTFNQSHDRRDITSCGQVRYISISELSPSTVFLNTCIRLLGDDADADSDDDSEAHDRSNATQSLATAIHDGTSTGDVSSTGRSDSVTTMLLLPVVQNKGGNVNIFVSSKNCIELLIRWLAKNALSPLARVENIEG